MPDGRFHPNLGPNGIGFGRPTGTGRIQHVIFEGSEAGGVALNQFMVGCSHSEPFYVDDIGLVDLEFVDSYAVRPARCVYCATLVLAKGPAFRGQR
jgi:hypothetical protein